MFENNNLSEIAEIPFSIERELQEITEKNTNFLFGIEFITSEFELGGLRIDSLCFDKEVGSFVIVEYKKDRNISVIDQGFAYFSLLLHNKAEFVLKYNEVKKTFLKRE